MFESYKEGQPIAVKIFEKALKEEKLSHAYLIDTNNYSKAYDLILCFVKAILCSTNHSESDECDVCLQIEHGNYLEFKVIEPDGAWIKKEQLSDLQEDFSTKAVLGSKRIYLIKDCDRMNSYAANSILKFLEEPVDNIIAILMTNNVSSLLETIISRCQVIRLNNDVDNCMGTLDRVFADKQDENLLNNLLNFVDELSDKKLGCIVNIKKNWHDYFGSRQLVEQALDLLIKYYYDVLLVISGKDVKYFVDYKDHVFRISKLNTVRQVMAKLDILMESSMASKFNLNLNLFVDKLVIDMVGD